VVRCPFLAQSGHDVLHWSARKRTRLRRDLYRNIRTYKCRSAGARRYREGMWKNVLTTTLGTAAITVWFAVVTLGFGAHLWPLLEGVR
jgi:hypothetical protein